MTMEIENKKAKSSDKLGSYPITPLIIKMSLPSMFSMLILALYNIVDSIFVSRLGESALSAVSLIYPIQLLLVAVGVGTGVGLSSLISRRLGAQNVEEADSAANHGVFLATCSWLVFSVFALIGMPAFVKAFSENPDLIEPAIAYGRIVCCGSLFSFNATNGERTMQACGNMTAPMYCSLVGAVTNVVLDPVMIFGYMGFPAMGVAGAAYATIIGQLFSMIATFVFIKYKDLPVQIKLKGFKPKAETIKNIYEVGLPSMVMQAIGSVATVLLNKILISFSESAVAVLGIYFKLESFVFMPVFGMNQGVIPILGYNYGARNRARLVETFRKALIIAFSIMLVGTIVFNIMPEKLLSMFNAEGELLSIGTKALKTISICFPFAALGIIPGTLFTATNHARNSMVTSLARQIIVKVPLAYLFSRMWGVMGIWYSYPCAELVSLSISMYYLRKLFKTDINNLDKIDN